MIKLKAPFNCTSASANGVVYKTNRKGIITVPVEAAGDLIKFHKFTTVTEDVSNEVEKEEISKPDEIKKAYESVEKFADKFSDEEIVEKDDL